MKYTVSAFDPKQNKTIMKSSPMPWIHLQGFYHDYLTCYGDFCEIKITPETDNAQGNTSD